LSFVTGSHFGKLVGPNRSAFPSRQSSNRGFSASSFSGNIQEILIHGLSAIGMEGIDCALEIGAPSSSPYRTHVTNHSITISYLFPLVTIV
jgi:hypothetical protein